MLMHFSPFARLTARSTHRRRRVSATAGGSVIQPRREAAMGIEVQPVHGHHCICQRCQRQSTGR